MPPEPLIVHVGDVVQLKKAHPCGAALWTVVRVGSDVVLFNADCDRRITLPRSKFNKAIKSIVPRGTQ